MMLHLIFGVLFKKLISPVFTADLLNGRYVLKKIKMAKQTEWQRAATQQELRLVRKPYSLADGYTQQCIVSQQFMLFPEP